MNQVHKTMPRPPISEAQLQVPVKHNQTKETFPTQAPTNHGRTEAPSAMPPRMDCTELSSEGEAITAFGKDTAPATALTKQPWLAQEDSATWYDGGKQSCSKVSLKVISRSFNSLAAAHTKGQVQSVIATAQRNITSLKFSATFGEAEERMKARAALASMQKLLQRGGRKIRRLNEEELASLRQKRTKRLQNQRRVLQLKQEREQLRIKRLSADGAIQEEGKLEELNQSMRFRRQGRYDPYDTISPPPAAPALPAPIAPLPAAGTIAVGTTAVDTAGTGAIPMADISLPPIPTD